MLFVLLAVAAIAFPHSAFAESHWSLRGGLDLLAVVPEKFRPREYFSPRKYPDLQGREYPSGTLTLIAEGRPQSWLKFYSQSLLDVDGTALNTEGGIYNYHDVFQHKLYGAKFEEAFADLTLGSVGVKVGLQKFV